MNLVAIWKELGQEALEKWEGSGMRITYLHEDKRRSRYSDNESPEKVQSD